jgi:hypothetical protein
MRVARANFDYDDFRHRLSDLNDSVWFDYSLRNLRRMNWETSALFRPREELVHVENSWFTGCSVKPFDRFEPSESLTVVVNFECPDFACETDLISMALFPTFGARTGPFNSTPLYIDHKFAFTDAGGYNNNVEPKAMRVCDHERGCTRWRMALMFTIEALPVDESVYVLKLKLTDPLGKHKPLRDHFEMDEMCVPLIVTEAVSGSSVPHAFVTPHEQVEATARTLGVFSLLAPSYPGDGATSFNPFLPKLVMPCDVFHATLTKTHDYDVRRRLEDLAARGVKQHVIFSATVGRSGTTHLANLVASSGQVVVGRLPSRFEVAFAGQSVQSRRVVAGRGHTRLKLLHGRHKKVSAAQAA